MHSPSIPQLQSGLTMQRHTLRPPRGVLAAAATGASHDGGGMLWRRRRTVAGVDQGELVEPEALVDGEGQFLELKGVKIHHKICHPVADDADGEENSQAPALKGPPVPMVLLHGFGASVFSWERVLQPLAKVAVAPAVAFDRPAFGLTSRVRRGAAEHPHPGGPKPMNPYSMAFSALATLSFIDALNADKAILIGHSAGCLVAAEAYFQAPERVAALVLVAPAIVAPVFGHKKSKKKVTDVDDAIGTNAFSALSAVFVALLASITGCVSQLLQGMREVIKVLYIATVTKVLRSAIAVMLVRFFMDKLGLFAVRKAWYDPSGVNEHVVQAYTKPLKVRNWDVALLEHLSALILDSSEVPIAHRLSNISCPVLVITGDTDRLVPSWSSKRVAEAIPGAAFEVIKKCGHLPQEERPEEFVAVIRRFRQRVWGAPAVHLQPAA